MINKIYSIYDRIAQEAGPVFNAKNDGTAMRSYINMLKEVGRREDYCLMCFGTFDNEELKIELLGQPFEVVELREVEE